MVEGIARDPSTPLGRAVNGPWREGDYLAREAVAALRALVTSYLNVHRSQGTPAREVDPVPLPPLTRYQRKAQKRSRRGEKRLNAADLELMRQIEQRRRG